MKKIAIFLLIVIIMIGLFYSITDSQTINVNDYIKDKFPSIFSFYLSSLENLDSYEKEFIDLLEKLPEEEQEYYAKEVYKNGFSLELLKNIREGKTIQAPTIRHALPSTPQQKEESTENLPTLIKRIKPSVVIIFAYDDKGEFLKLGSGFFISQNGDIVTNYHVLQGANSAEVKTSDDKTYPITYIVAENEQSDIICLSVDIPSQYVYPLSLSITIPEVGERIIVYGSPLGWGNTVSDGIVSAIRDIPDYGKVIQITAPISPGSSGSPVLNMQGEVIGIATFQSIEGQNLNFAIPSERIANIDLKRETFPYLKKYKKSEEKKDFDYAYEAFNKALYFMEKEEYDKALLYLEIAIKTDILSLKEYVYFEIGVCNHELGNYIKAIEACKRVLHINPNHAIAYYNLGLAYYSLGFYKDAIEAFKQAIRIDPDYVNAYYNLGNACNSLGFYKDAIEAFKQAIRIDPNDAESYNNLGIAYGSLGFYKDAIEAFKQAIRIDSDCANPHFGLGCTYFIIGDKSSALNEYKILKNLDINFANELFDLIY
jgi:tetratricopeptide (TPR) repeat protein